MVAIVSCSSVGVERKGFWYLERAFGDVVGSRREETAEYIIVQGVAPALEDFSSAAI